MVLVGPLLLSFSCCGCNFAGDLGTAHLRRLQERRDSEYAKELYAARREIQRLRTQLMIARANARSPDPEGDESLTTGSPTPAGSAEQPRASASDARSMTAETPAASAAVAAPAAWAPGDRASVGPPPSRPRRVPSPSPLPAHPSAHRSARVEADGAPTGAAAAPHRPLGDSGGRGTGPPNATSIIRRFVAGHGLAPARSEGAADGPVGWGLSVDALDTSSGSTLPFDLLPSTELARASAAADPAPATRLADRRSQLRSDGLHLAVSSSSGRASTSSAGQGRGGGVPVHSLGSSSSADYSLPDSDADETGVDLDSSLFAARYPR